MISNTLKGIFSSPNVEAEGTSSATFDRKLDILALVKV